MAPVMGVVGMLVATGASAGASAPADGGEGFMGRLWDSAERALSAVARGMPHPPVPVKVTYSPAVIGTWDPAFGDAIDLAVAPGHLALLNADALRIATFPGPVWNDVKITEPVAIRPRDPVGAIAIWREGQALQIVARSSAHGGLISGHPVEAGEDDGGYPVCPGVTATLAAGRNYFSAASVPLPGKAGAIYNIECHDFIDTQGWPARAIGAVSLTGILAIRVTRSCPDGAAGCTPGTVWEGHIDGVGDAFALTDLNRDGRIDAVVSSATAPGDPDEARVLLHVDDDLTVVFSQPFPGGIAAMATGDIDASGDEDVVVADRYSLWRLDQP